MILKKHQKDALGRETNTVVSVGTTPGEAASSTWQSPVASSSLASLSSFVSLTSTTYPYGGSDYSVSTDARGATTIRRIDILADCVESGEAVFTNGVEVVKTKSRSFFGGGSSLRREWAVGSTSPATATGGSPSPATAWTEERRFDEYDALGRRVAFVVTESSDCGVVTNSVSTYDLLGRLVSTKTPLGTTAYSYDGASSRISQSVFTAEDVRRVTDCLYDACGELVGAAAEGVTSRTDVAYEVDASNVAWRVTTEASFGSRTNDWSVTRERLNELDGGLRSCVDMEMMRGVKTRVVRVFDEASGVTTETRTASDGATVVSRSRFGVEVELETDDETRHFSFDAFGRIVREERSPLGESARRPVLAYEYSAAGDLIAVSTFTNEAAAVTEAYAYDTLGRRVAVTDALGNVTRTDCDAIGNVVAEDGTAYPIRRTYDTAGRRTALATTRDGSSWDETRWAHDAATGLCTEKSYADGSTVAYAHTADGLPLHTTFASGRWTENVYDSRRQIIGRVSSDGSDDAAFTRDEFGQLVASSNAAASVARSLSDGGTATNETWTVGEETLSIRRETDGHGRLARLAITGADYEQHFVYADDGRLSAISNSEAFVAYAYTPDRQDAGYTLTLANGTTFTRSIARDGFRRSLATAITNASNGVAFENFDYAYDALSRPTSRNADAFGYNDRGEVTAAVVSGIRSVYNYDEIGNSTYYTPNGLNQYEEFSYDADGNLLTDGTFSFTYDAVNRLVSVSTNGILVLANFYDANSRRVKKVTPEYTVTFFYDDWNLIEERIVHTNGTTSTIHYYWGKDLSGTVQGAGGIGGLLYLAVDGAIYIPCYDNNGNVTRYLDTNGNTVAQYTYDAFGNITSKSGALADFFRHRFSTKHFDGETGFYYYGYRFYHPPLMRWLNRDPIGEEGGVNLYGFCRNCPVIMVDPMGGDIYLYTGNDSGNFLNDAVHQTVAVDTWSDDCPPKKTGVRGFSFGYNGEWGWNWPNGKWLGHSSLSLPGYWMVGEIYEASVVGKVVKTKKTTPKQDKAWLKSMESRIGTKDVYSVGRHNCRSFAQAEFDKAPQREDTR